MLRRQLAAALLAVAVLASHASHAQIVLPGTQPGDLQNWPLLGSSECQTCHGGYVAGLDYEPWDTWAGSMMANAGRDPLFWAALDIANQDLPGAGEFCLRCHSPRGWLEGRSSTADGSALIGHLDETDNDFDGIDCHFCHRMYEGETGTQYTENGQYWIDDGTPTVEPARRGPYVNTFAPHEAVYSELHTSSELCGTCHNLKNPLVELLDENGVGTGLDFPEQLTYDEWANSAFAAEGTECQDCHMPPAPVTPAYACNSFNPPRPDVVGGDPTPVYTHDMVGANTFIPQVLKGEYGFELNREAAYQYTIEKAYEMLQQHSATVEISGDALAVEDDSLTVNVRVTNLSGHKLPTGYPEGRRMWLHLEAADALGAVFFESGAYDDSTATLSEDPQLRIYETKHGVHGQGPGFHLVLNNRIYTDTRIPPRGFVPSVGCEPIGIDYPVQMDGSLAHWDDAGFRVPVPAGVQGPLQVKATLRYQTASREYIEFLRDENVSGPDPNDRDYPNAPSRGQKMHDFWMVYGKSAPVDMQVDQMSVPVTTAPSNVSSLDATPGHNRVQLSWSLPAQASGVTILRRGWTGYPEYGSAPAALPAPLLHEKFADALAAGWSVVYDGAALSFEDTSFDDASRDIVAYAAYAYDAQGVHARMTPQAQAMSTSYLLADLGDVGTPGVYDGAIDGAHDLPVFSLAYGSAAGEPGWNAEVDVAPTSDGTRDGIPLPDDQVNFQDLLVFSLQFGRVDGAVARGPVAAREESGSPVVLRVGESVEVDGRTRVPLFVEGGAGQLRAVHLEWSGTDLLAVQAGEMVRQSGHPHFAAIDPFAGAVAADLALLGPDVALGKDGHLADLIFRRAPAEGSLESALAFDVAGRALEVEWAGRAPSTPAALRAPVALSPNVPNPFNPRTSLELTLERGGEADVAVYDLAGRRVTTLVHGALEAGAHTLVWKGIDDAGAPVASGVYLVRAHALGTHAVRRVVLVR